MKLILALLALAALTFEIYQALHHLYDAPIEQSWLYRIGVFLTLAACGFGIADMWHHFRHVREHDSRNSISVALIVGGIIPVLVSPLVFYVAAIHFRAFLIWPLWAGAAGIAAIALGALIEVNRDYSPTEIDLFAWARNKEELQERKERVDKAYDEMLARRQYYKEHPEKLPPRMPNPNPNITKYIV